MTLIYIPICMKFFPLFGNSFIFCPPVIEQAVFTDISTDTGESNEKEMHTCICRARCYSATSQWPAPDDFWNVPDSVGETSLNARCML